MLGYLRAQLKDPLFMRVCMFLWGLPFALLGPYGAVILRPAASFEWFGFAMLAALGSLGLYLLGVAAFGSDARVHKTTDFMHEGGELLGIVFAIAVILVAVPLTELLRAIIRRSRA